MDFALTTPDPFGDWQMRAMLLSACALIPPILSWALTAPLSLFLTYMCAGWVLGGYRYHGLEHIAFLSAGLLIAHAVTRWKINLAPALSYLGAFQAVFGLCEWVGWNIWNYPDVWLYKPTALLGQETQLGAFLAACLAPALFSKRYWCAIPIALCVMATHSSFSLAAAGAVILLWIAKEWGMGTAALLGAMFSFLLIAGYEMWPLSDWLDPHGRLDFWQLGWAGFLKSPILGHGPGSWLQSSTMIFDFRVAYLHNEYLEFLYEYGLAGATIAVFSIRQFLMGFRLTWHHAMVGAIMIDAFGNFPFHVAPIGILFLIGWMLSVEGIHGCDVPLG